MGYNTVCFLLNDMMDSIEKSPKATVYGLSHPPMSNSERDLQRWRQMVDSVAEENGEPLLHFQALEVPGTFHADEHKFFLAGGNCITELKVVKLNKKARTITLQLPEWMPEEGHFCYFNYVEKSQKK